MLDIFETLAQLAQIHSPSGHEGKVSDAIRDLAAPYADEIYTDTLGNLICVKKGTSGGKKVMMAAHMDSIGMIVTHVDDKGFIRFSNLGGLSPVLLLGTPVVFANGTRGVIYKDENVETKDLKLFNLYIDIGYSSREDTLKFVKVADTAVYSTETYLAGNRIVSPYLDNRISCVILLLALESIKETKNDLYFVFTTQEELGTRGARTASFGIEPDVGIAIDVTRSGDTPEPRPKMETKLGGGAAIKIIDSTLICSPQIVRALENSAKANEIKYQFEVLEAGGTDAGPMQQSRAGAYAGAISIATRYIHSPQEMADLDDVKAAAALLSVFVSDNIELN